MIPILMPHGLTVSSPISLPGDLPAAIKNAHHPVDPGISLEGWLIGRVEISFFEVIPIRIVFSANNRVAVRNNHRLPIDTDEGGCHLIATFVVLGFPGMIAILV